MASSYPMRNHQSKIGDAFQFIYPLNYHLGISRPINRGELFEITNRFPKFAVWYFNFQSIISFAEKLFCHDMMSNTIYLSGKLFSCITATRKTLSFEYLYILVPYTSIFSVRALTPFSLGKGNTLSIVTNNYHTDVVAFQQIYLFSPVAESKFSFPAFSEYAREISALMRE